MAASRHDKALMRQRGVGFQREINEEDFGFSLAGIVVAPASAATAAQRQTRTPGSSNSTAARSSPRGANLRSSSQYEATQVDENGSVVKKRRLTPPPNALTTPSQVGAAKEEAAGGPGAAGSAQKASAGKKRKKRKAISQGYMVKKRSSIRSRPSTSSIEGAEPGSLLHDVPEQVAADVDDEVDGNAGAAAVVDNLPGYDEIPDAVMDPAESYYEEQEDADLDLKPVSGKDPVHLPWQRKQTARKSTGGPVKRSRPFRTNVSTEDTVAASARPYEDSPTELDAVPQETGADEEGVSIEDQSKPSSEPRPTSPAVEFRPAPNARRKGRRKSVNPIQQERKRKRDSLEAARRASEEPGTIQRSARPGRKLAVQRPVPPKVTKRTQTETILEKLPISQSDRLSKKPAKSRPAVTKQSKRTSIESQPSEETTRAKPGSIGIRIFRSNDTRALSPIAEDEDEDIFESLSAAPPSKLPNAIEALSQVSGEIIGSGVESAKRLEEKATGRAERSAAKRRRTAIEAFGRQLESRFLDMAQALEHRSSVRLRLRQVKKARKALHKELIGSRGEEDSLTSDMYRLRSKRDLAAGIENDDKQITGLYKKLGRAIRAAKTAQQEDDDVTPEGLEYELQIAESYSTVGGRQGLLRKIKVFNARLEELLMGG